MCQTEHDDLPSRRNDFWVSCIILTERDNDLGLCTRAVVFVYIGSLMMVMARGRPASGPFAAAGRHKLERFHTSIFGLIVPHTGGPDNTGIRSHTTARYLMPWTDNMYNEVFSSTKASKSPVSFYKCTFQGAF